MAGKSMGQSGFSLLELLVVMSIVGVLAVIAVPRFTNAISLANTTKVQADLQTLNTAIVMYQAQHGKAPANLTTDLQDYIVDADKLHPPKGECLLRTGGKVEITDTSYVLDTNSNQALCQTHAVNDFGRPES